MSVMRVIALSPCTKSEVRPTPLRKIWRIFRLSINRPGDLDLWPFDLLMGSPITCVMGFLPAKFQLATPFHSGLRVRHGQTDRRSDRRRPSTLNASHCGGRSIKYDNVRLVNLCIIIIIIIILPTSTKPRAWKLSKNNGCDDFFFFFLLLLLTCVQKLKYSHLSLMITKH